MKRKNGESVTKEKGWQPSLIILTKDTSEEKNREKKLTYLRISH